jgi:hypothetical protein
LAPFHTPYVSLPLRSSSFHTLVIQGRDTRICQQLAGKRLKSKLAHTNAGAGNWKKIFSTHFTLWKLTDCKSISKSNHRLAIAPFDNKCCTFRGVMVKNCQTWVGLTCDFHWTSRVNIIIFDSQSYPALTGNKSNWLQVELWCAPPENWSSHPHRALEVI